MIRLTLQTYKPKFKLDAKFKKKIRASYKNSRLRFFFSFRGRYYRRRAWRHRLRLVLKNKKWTILRHQIRNNIYKGYNRNQKWFNYSKTRYNFYKQSFAYKDKIRKFYGFKTEHKFKKSYLRIFRYGLIFKTAAFLAVFEQRLDVIIFRLGLFPTLHCARNFIKYNGLEVDHLITYSSDLQLQVGNIIGFLVTHWVIFYFRYTMKIRLRLLGQQLYKKRLFKRRQKRLRSFYYFFYKKKFINNFLQKFSSQSQIFLFSFRIETIKSLIQDNIILNKNKNLFIKHLQFLRKYLILLLYIFFFQVKLNKQINYNLVEKQFFLIFIKQIKKLLYYINFYKKQIVIKKKHFLLQIYEKLILIHFQKLFFLFQYPFIKNYLLKKKNFLIASIQQQLKYCFFLLHQLSTDWINRQLQNEISFLKQQTRFNLYQNFKDISFFLKVWKKHIVQYKKKYQKKIFWNFWKIRYLTKRWFLKIKEKNLLQYDKNNFILYYRFIYNSQRKKNVWLFRYKKGKLPSSGLFGEMFILKDFIKFKFLLLNWIICKFYWFKQINIKNKNFKKEYLLFCKQLLLKFLLFEKKLLFKLFFRRRNLIFIKQRLWFFRIFLVWKQIVYSWKKYFFSYYKNFIQININLKNILNQKQFKQYLVYFWFYLYKKKNFFFNKQKNQKFFLQIKLSIFQKQFFRYLPTFKLQNYKYYKNRFKKQDQYYLWWYLHYKKKKKLPLKKIYFYLLKGIYQVFYLISKNHYKKKKKKISLYKKKLLLQHFFRFRYWKWTFFNLQKFKYIHTFNLVVFLQSLTKKQNKKFLNIIKKKKKIIFNQKKKFYLQNQQLIWTYIHMKYIIWFIQKRRMYYWLRFIYYLHSYYNIYFLQKGISSLIYFLRQMMKILISLNKYVIFKFFTNTNISQNYIKYIKYYFLYFIQAFDLFYYLKSKKKNYQLNKNFSIKHLKWRHRLIIYLSCPLMGHIRNQNLALNFWPVRFYRYLFIRKSKLYDPQNKKHIRQWKRSLFRIKLYKSKMIYNWYIQYLLGKFRIRTWTFFWYQYRVENFFMLYKLQKSCRLYYSSLRFFFFLKKFFLIFRKQQKFSNKNIFFFL